MADCMGDGLCMAMYVHEDRLWKDGMVSHLGTLTLAAFEIKIGHVKVIDHSTGHDPVEFVIDWGG